VCELNGILFVYSLSRLARSTKGTLAIPDRLQKADADLVSLSEKLDTNSAAGKMVFRMLAVLEEFESDQISERTKKWPSSSNDHAKSGLAMCPMGSM
jgi:site-specific DNA recombinase